MTLKLFFATLLLTAPALASRVCDATLRPDGLTIPNARYVGNSTQVIRGHAPNKHIAELPKAGIEHVLIIKNEIRKEVTEEIVALNALNIEHHHIAYRWKDLDTLKACEQTIEALDYIQHVTATSDKKLYVHCTAGIDRTGLISALYRLLQEPRSTPFKMFEDEMCANGYGDATFARPKPVKDAIHKELTPIYLKLADAIVKNRKTNALLTREACQAEVFQSPALEQKVASQLDKYKCKSK